MKMQEIKGGVGKSEGSCEGIGCWGKIQWLSLAICDRTGAALHQKILITLIDPRFCIALEGRTDFSCKSQVEHLWTAFQSYLKGR